ncbi:hypothetical protein FC75_GL001712 [Lacticaseibacillus camelliae DSM 22697 = JCM 13995]|uniref:BPL/LPL catalytic domain-containing protein n=2 Tax=Lacticaseibacillus camelliae TaxID=381742 RepID=A0A0R2F3L6_9LACO|nr:hypothetical protein FC75_GL001712 [Lacticaseibacillus camelliae DSM 22697 = JCM 13995]
MAAAFLPEESMALTQALQNQLPEKWRAGLQVFDRIDSTNLEAARQLESDPQLPLLLVASAQTAGIGRRGRTFVSPAATGLYWTAVFTLPAATPQGLVTPAAGVALQAAVTSALDVPTQLKWVNDLINASGKVAGILAQAASGNCPHLIVGIGINLAPDPKRQLAAPGQPIGSLLPAIPDDATKAALVAQWAAHFDSLLRQAHLIMPAFRAHAAWLGELVTLSEPAHVTVGRLVGFADDGAIILDTANGEQQFHDGTLRRR